MRVEEGDANRPFQYADPRSLSEAWYEALYADRGRHERAGRGAGSAVPAAVEPPRTQPVGTGELAAGASSGERLAHAAAQDVRTANGAVAGRPLADRERVRERAQGVPALAPRETAATRRTTVELSDEGRRITLLLAQRGAHVSAVAIGDAAAADRISEALAHARAALAVKGIRLDHATRNRGEG